MTSHGVEHESAQEQFAGDPIDTAAAARAAEVERRRDAASGAAAPAQSRQPSDRVTPVGLSPDSDGDLGVYSSASWAEAGMPLRLRDAIASVRRVSHELYQGALPDHGALPATPRSGHGGDDDFLAEPEPASDSPRDDGPAKPDDRPVDGHDHLQADRMDGPTNDILFHHAAISEAWPSAHNGLQEEFERAFQREQIELEDGAATDELGLRVLEHDEHAQALRHGAAYQALGDASREEVGDASREEVSPDPDDEDEEPPSAPGEELHDHLPARRGTTAGYGVHVTALAGAIVFVALAGFGFAMLSDSAERSTPERDTATAAPAGEELSPPPASTKAPPQLDELVTVRVAPPPGDAFAEPASVTPTRAVPPAGAVAPTRALPLPPPPKPDLPQAATDQVPRDSQLGDATADAAIIPALADEPVERADSAASDGEGTGGPFEPLFAKRQASQADRGQVLVQYVADAAAGPATAMHVVRQLRAAGFSVEARAVPFSIRANSIRYFFPGDRDEAQALRASLEGQLPGGAALSVMDFSSFEPKPQEGHLEVWLRS